MKTLPERKSK